jgi:hypothetical protein
MARAFVEAHGDAVTGTLSMVDRLIFKGHFMSFYPRGSFAAFLARQGIQMKAFGKYVRRATEQIKGNAKMIADEAGRPYVYMAHMRQGKDEWAKDIAAKDGITEGLIAVLATVELCDSFGVEIDPKTHMLEVARRPRKCIHIYFYFIDPEFGFMHVRMQTWFPLMIQVYINGREWLARQLDKRGIGYERYENTLLRIDDLKMAARLCERFGHRRWPRVLDALARRVNPWLPVVRRFTGAGYYWVIDQCEVATDVMWRDRPTLQHVLPDLIDHAIRELSAEDVMRFLGRARPTVYKGEVVSDDKRVPTTFRGRPEGRRVKHRVGRNWIKMYDKWSVLRVETTINKPKDFRVYRSVPTRKGRKRREWAKMTKGVANLWRYIQVSRQANERYLEALAAVRSKREAVVELDGLCRSRIVQGKRYSRFNPVTTADCDLFCAVLAGENAITGFRNRHLQDRLYPNTSPADRKRRSARVNRLISKLRGHGLLAKVPGSRIYRVTSRGHQVMSAAIHYRKVAFPEGLKRTA